MADYLKKRIQIVGFNHPLCEEKVIFTDTNKLTILPQKYRVLIDQYWQKNHAGWVSSPLLTLEEIVLRDDGKVEVKTGISEYKDYKGADIIARSGDLKILDLEKSIGNQTMMKTKDGFFIFGLRGSKQPTCPNEYDCGGGMLAVMYCMDNAVAKLKSRAHLPPNERYCNEELTFQWNNPFLHFRVNLSNEYGISKKEINESSIRLLGFPRGIFGGRDPGPVIYAELNITSKEYLEVRREKANWFEKNTGKKQDEKRIEIEQVAFIDELSLPNFLLNEIEADSLGNALTRHPLSGKYEIVDRAIGACILYLKPKHETVLNLVNRLGKNDCVIEFLEPEQDNTYRFMLNDFIVE